MTDDERITGPWYDKWMTALEGGARVDSDALLAGSARWTDVTDLVIAPGEATARAAGSGRASREVRIGVRRWSATQWDAAIVALAESAAHAVAASLGTLDPGASELLERAGAPLLPGPADVSWECTCREMAVPCAHQAAVAAAVGRALDLDPLALLVLRGRERVRVLSQINERRPRRTATLFETGTATAPQSTHSTSAEDAWAGRRPGDPLERPLPVVRPSPAEETAPPGWAAAPPATDSDAPQLADLILVARAASLRARAALLAREEAVEEGDPEPSRTAN